MTVDNKNIPTAQVILQTEFEEHRRTRDVQKLLKHEPVTEKEIDNIIF